MWLWQTVKQARGPGASGRAHLFPRLCVAEVAAEVFDLLHELSLREPSQLALLQLLRQRPHLLVEVVHGRDVRGHSLLQLGLRVFESDVGRAEVLRQTPRRTVRNEAAVDM